MSVRYRRWDADDVVSEDWHTVLAAARADGVPFSINDGHRTMALQAQRVREHGVWSPSNPTGAARPSATAPHIRVGRQDHALDGSLRALAEWLRRHGVPMRFPIATEPWHGEVASERALHALAVKLRDPLRNLTPEERHLCVAYDSLRRRHLNLPRRRRLRAAMTRQRKRIWRAAQTDGWNARHRRERYAQLLKRTR